MMIRNQSLRRKLLDRPAKFQSDFTTPNDDLAPALAPQAGAFFWAQARNFCAGFPLPGVHL